MKVKQYYFRIYYSNASGIIRVYHSLYYESSRVRNRALSAILCNSRVFFYKVCDVVKLSEYVEL